MNQFDVHYATNNEIARVLFQVASLLDLFGDNNFRVRSYRRAALGVLLLPKQIVQYVSDDAPIPVPGIGQRMDRRLRELVNTGHMAVYDVLLQDLGEPLASLLTVPGIGPRTAIRLMRELDVTSLEDLADAANAGRIRELRGFGTKREANLGSAVEEVLAGRAA